MKTDYQLFYFSEVIIVAVIVVDDDKSVLNKNSKKWKLIK
jgi:hypothetical protein